MEEIALFAVSFALRDLWRRQLLEYLEDPRSVVSKLYGELYLVSANTEAERIASILVRRVGELE
jgi:hypothetical protein